MGRKGANLFRLLYPQRRHFHEGMTKLAAGRPIGVHCKRSKPEGL